MSAVMLSEEVTTKAKTIVDKYGYSSVEAYIEHLISTDVRSVPGFSNVKELKELIEEGLTSPMETMTEQDWSELRKAVTDQARRRRIDG